jgi:predicted RNase H-like nuclease (RuvC/YqgF family)
MPLVITLTASHAFDRVPGIGQNDWAIARDYIYEMRAEVNNWTTECLARDQTVEQLRRTVEELQSKNSDSRTRLTKVRTNARARRLKNQRIRSQKRKCIALQNTHLLELSRTVLELERENREFPRFNKQMRDLERENDSVIEENRRCRSGK